MGHEHARAWHETAPPHLRVAYTRRAAAPLRVAIVDDDPAGRERLRPVLEAAPDVEIVGAGMTGDGAIALAGSVLPDILFVAVRDPRLNPLASVAALPPERRPAIIVIAEREEYAFHAFETQAIDYLLVPFSDDRLERSLARARRLLGAPPERPSGPVRSPRAGLATRRLIVRTPGQLTFIPLAEIDWVESAGNYVRVHAGPDTHTTRESMKSVEVRLDDRFIRVHRGAIVNSDRIRRISNDESGHPWVILKDGTQISAGRYIEGMLREWVNSAC
jgi:two-component system LytT family response regulator